MVYAGRSEILGRYCWIGYLISPGNLTSYLIGFHYLFVHQGLSYLEMGRDEISHAAQQSYHRLHDVINSRGGAGVYYVVGP